MTTPLSYAWLIPLLPTVGFLINMLFGAHLGKRGGPVISVLLMLISVVLAGNLLWSSHQAAPKWDAHVVPEVVALEHTLHDTETELEYLTTLGATTARLDAVNAEIDQIKHTLHELEHHALTQTGKENFPFSVEFPWLHIAGEEGIPFGLYIDPFAALMIFMVTLVCMLIHLFSLEYMQGEARYSTFFAYLSLFSAAMLAMVMSRNLFHVLLFWEVMGVMSYLLIGFFYRKVSAQQAMKKAFLVTKFADIGLLIALFWLYRVFGTLDMVRIWEAAPHVLSGMGTVATAIGLLLFVAAIGKSAQFPLHVWLLDAMEGPTPVSAMIHAATMVAAGVYLIARMYPVLELGHTLSIVAAIGAVTALMAAILGTAFADIKKILAWSTVSQLGFMFLGLGAFGWVAAVFHLVTHAFFKALLFLCSGSMIHGSGTQDIFEMDALGRHMKSTQAAFLIGGLSLAGVVPFAGFWSKDEILLALKHAASGSLGYSLLLGMAYVSSLLTAYYITRAYIIAFQQPHSASPWNTAPWHQNSFGELNMSQEDLKQDAQLESHNHPSPPHESGWRILTALWVLAISATVIGLLGSPLLGNWVQLFVYQGAIPHLETLSAQMPGFITGTLLALGGILLGFIIHATDLMPLTAPAPLTRLLQKRFYLDRLYYQLIANPLTKLTAPAAWVDRWLIDGVIDLLGFASRVVGDVLRRINTGNLDHYLWWLAAGTLMLVVGLAFGGSV